jgi:hypothetical protein
MADLLMTELETYKAHKSELLAKSKGKFVLIKDDQIIGVFDSHKEAVRYGYEHLGIVPVLVKEIKEIDTPLRIFPALRDL